jgi:hypothetical protein
MTNGPAANDTKLPIVTVFGAGIAGLTVAHELVERGFEVQIVEAQEDDFEEYECAVGGLAANQYSRVRASITDLHPEVSDPDTVESLRRARQSCEEQSIQQTYPRFAIREHFCFDKRVHGQERIRGARPGRATDPEPDAGRTSFEPTGSDDRIPARWQDYWDEHGVHNSQKLHNVLATIREAAKYYMAAHLPKLARRLRSGEPSSGEWENGVFAPIRGNAALARSFAAREIFRLRIVGYTDSDGLAEENRAIAQRWAEEVRNALITLNNEGPNDLKVWQLEEQLEAVSHGSANPSYDQSTASGRRRSNRVEFQIVEQIIPGEHGFRFFPNFYRHLFDTMKRTPILDSHGDVTGMTAFDQLIPTPGAMLAMEDGTGPHQVDLRRFHSLHEIEQARKLFYDRLKFAPRDALGLQYFTLRYMMSGPSRRLNEAEPANFITYIGGQNPPKRYSEAALNFVNNAPRALAAMSATESDARTQLDITLQLMAIHPTKDFTADMTLNGPTSTVWLAHWKKYLKMQGVKFFVGRITALQDSGGRLVPTVEGPSGWSEPRPEEADHRYGCPETDGRDIDEYRFVLAIPFKQASDLVWAAYNAANAQASPPPFTGPLRQLMEFDKACGRRTEDGPRATGPECDTATGKPLGSYPLRTISGLQFFFPQEYRFGHGNIYFVDAPWGLTSISQFPYWRERIRPVGIFLGQISVDLGDWYAFYPADGAGPRPQLRGHTAWHSSCQEIATNTWQQITKGLLHDYAEAIVPPRYFHIDRNVVFTETRHTGFRGSIIIRVSRVARSSSRLDQNVLGLKWTADAWSRFAPGETSSLSVTRGAELDINVTDARQSLVEHINATHWRHFFATSEHQDNPADFMVSPKAHGDRFFIAFRSGAKSTGFISVNERSVSFTLPEPEMRAETLEQSIRKLAEELKMPLSSRPLSDDHSVFELASEGGGMFYTAVANRDGALELLDGPQLHVVSNIRNFRVVQPAIPGSGRVTTGAIRANAIVGLTPPAAQGAGPEPVQPGRLYGITLRVGSSGTRVDHECRQGERASEVRDQLVRKLLPTDFVLAQEYGEASIILSPIVELRDTIIHILGTSDKTFGIAINGEAIEVDGAGKSVSEVRDAIAARLRARYDLAEIRAIGDSQLSLSSGEGGNTFRIGVLNPDCKIELIGATPLTVEVKDLYLETPAAGFVPLRNDAEFLINIPGQWQARPGLCRREAPNAFGKYQELLGTETGCEPIFYGHRNCRLLEYWVSAGSYMATYTRVTTMEAANESGRHAVAAILYMLMQQTETQRAGAGRLPKPVLSGDFPEVWDVEDKEPDDFKFYKDLDEALFRDGLPHVLDILSITRLIETLLESEVPQQKVREFIQNYNQLIEGLRTPLIRGTGRAFSDLLDLYRDLAPKSFHPATGVDPITHLTSEFLRRYATDLSQAAKYYHDLWYRDRNQ